MIKGMKKFAILFIIATCLAIFVLPAGCSASDGETFQVTFSVNRAEAGTIEGETTQFISGGGTTVSVRAVPALGYTFTGWSDGTLTDTITVRPDRDISLTANFEILPYGLPVFEIETENGAPVLNKENYVPCTVSVGNTETKYCLDGAEAQIKLRGNVTKGYDKKPYKIKFTSKTDLFGFGKAKKWVLLADYLDGSMMRNRLALSCGMLLGLEETSHTQPVEVYFNGRYDGVYLLCEQTEAGGSRVDISEEILEGDAQPFLVELDNRAPDEGVEGLDWFDHWGDDGARRFFTVKSPEPEDEGYEARVTANISRIVNEVWSVVCDGTWEEIERRIDVNSFAKTCLVHQLFKTYDAVAFSWFLYKDAGADSKVKCGPLWDFDLSAGLGDDEHGPTPEVVPAEALWPNGENRANRWYMQLLEHIEFRTRMKELLETYGDALAAEFDGKAQEAKEDAASYHRNYERWGNLNLNSVYIPEEIGVIPTWEGHVDELVAYLKKSLNYLLNYYGEENK